MRTYNLFRRKDAADLYCAVPEDVALPAFLIEDTWDYAQALEVGALSGFDAAAAEAAALLNGFYLFHAADQSNSAGKT
ncbi:hypothetical protein, partial [Microvirga massiliensis]|uniref:hypothetical protein n=1 Tax=Microvirga massiliensis TaxID=1033741 RepID=UPI0007C81C2E